MDTAFQEKRPKRSDDYNWVPRAKYEMIMEKLDSTTMENHKLRAENLALRKACSDRGVVDLDRFAQQNS